MGVFDDYKEVKCKDGSTRHILKKLNNLPRIFGEFVPEWEFKINSGAKAAKELAEANVGMEIKKSAKKLYDEILEIDSTARTLFRMAYMQFTTNPCDNDGVLNKAINKIMRLVSKLSTINKTIERLKEQPAIEPTQFRTFDYVTHHAFKVKTKAKARMRKVKKARVPAKSEIAQIHKLITEIKSDLKATAAELR